MSKDDEAVHITLSRDEAIVLFALLARYCDDGHELRIEDQAEQRVLWNIQSDLESTLHEPINNPRYGERVAQARDAVRDKE
jgi:hypothetical protein